MIVSACVKFYTKEKVLGEEDFQIVIPPVCYDIPCHRHADAFYIISQFVGASEIDKPRTEQGFLTNKGKFLDRYAAMQHAIACGQLPPDADKECRELYSEDLW